MSFRRLNYTKPEYSWNKPTNFILDFGQLDRKSDYYRKESSRYMYGILLLGILIIASLSALYGYYSFMPGNVLDIKLPTTSSSENLAVAKTSPQPTKVVESINLAHNKKEYTYTVKSGDSYARLVKRAVTEFSVDQDLALSNGEINRSVTLIITQIERLPLHPGDTFAVPSSTINDAVLQVRP